MDLCSKVFPEIPRKRLPWKHFDTGCSYRPQVTSLLKEDSTATVFHLFRKTIQNTYLTIYTPPGNISWQHAPKTFWKTIFVSVPFLISKVQIVLDFNQEIAKMWLKGIKHVHENVLNMWLYLIKIYHQEFESR